TTNAAASSTINSGLAGLADNYQTFLSLLTTQLKNQDPLSPLDTNQFTQQLTQMTGVEQQLLSNQQLQQQVNQNQTTSSLDNSVGLIGKTVSVNGDSSVLAGGKATFEFSLPTAPGSMTLSVVDSNNKVVWSGDVTPTGSGAQTFTWDGKDSTGAQTADGGTYTLTIAAKDPSGAAISAATTMQGTATAVQQVSGTTMVTVNGAQVPLSSIIGVST
ncbi:MAG: flagellar hook capping FlgD N-terminal domain-containing protein, partial [Mycobacterium sp.]|nr:flagellar hook capping FlgD N-terminal domain-containing protein [Mycobacterium sp.]